MSAASRWDVSLQTQAGEFSLDARFSSDARVLGLFGPSGAGKSTVVECLAGVRSSGGRIALGGEVWLESGHAVKVARERGVGWVPQEGALFPHLTVAENLAFGWREGVDRDRVVEVLGLAGLLLREPDTLSGGERQRAALGRALCAGPKLLLLDEPLGGVDLPRRARVFRFLLEVREAFDLPMLYVSHDPAEVLAIAEEVVLIDNGHVTGQGAPRTLLADATALRMLDQLGFQNVFRVEPVAPPEPGHAIVVRTASGSALVAPAGPRDLGSSGWLAIRAEDVMLAAEPPGRISARNVLEGEVVGVEPLEEHLLVRVRAGEEWVATLTRRAVADLGLEPGARAWVVAKTHAFHWLAE